MTDQEIAEQFWRSLRTRADLLKALALARSEEREEGMKGWQPIEAAPKDGTIVLLVRGVLCYGYFFTGNDRSTGWITLKIGRNRDADTTIDGPTHWMPIPALPVVEPLAVPAVPNPTENPGLSTREKENEDQPSPETKGSER